LFERESERQRDRERSAIAVISFLAGFAVAMAARIISGGGGDARGFNIINFRLTLLSIMVLQQFLPLLLLLSFCTSSSALILNGTVGVRNFFVFPLPNSLILTTSALVLAV
jgi:hypothetical protein